MKKHTIMGVHVDDRLKEAATVQQVLTKYGQNIKTRLGLHEVEQGKSAVNGLLVLEVVGADAESAAMSAALNAIEGIEVKTMVFDHPDVMES
jgi:Iron-only hydrogenase system regulator, putative